MKFYFALLLIAGPLTHIVQAQDPCQLPTWPACGHLSEAYFGNLNHITGITEFPWIARLGYETYRGISYKCLAILITVQHLLSPAHCHDDGLIDEPLRYALLGDWNPANPYMERDCDRCTRLPQLIEIAEIAIHPEYNSQEMTNDISVLKLVQPVTYSSAIRPICLPPLNTRHDPHIGRLLYSTGFALNNSIPYKLKSLVQMLGAKQCRQTLVGLNKLSAAIPFEMSHLCGISNLNMTLMTGSALMGLQVDGQEPQNFYLVGLLVNGTDNTPLVFMRVDLYRGWIERNVRCSMSGSTKIRSTTPATFKISPAIEKKEIEPRWN